jgi:hypothetical protein
MKKQALTVIKIEALARSNLTAPEPVSLDGEDYPSKPETRGRAALRWFIDSFALAACSMACVYVGVWLDPPTSPATRSQEDRPEDDLSDSFAAERTSAKEQVPAWPCHANDSAVPFGG